MTPLLTHWSYCSLALSSRSTISRWHMLWKSFLIEEKDLFILHNQYHGCWCSDSLHCQGNSGHSIDCAGPEYSSFNIRNLQWKFSKLPHIHNVFQLPYFEAKLQLKVFRTFFQTWSFVCLSNVGIASVQKSHNTGWRLWWWSYVASPPKYDAGT